MGKLLTLQELHRRSKDRTPLYLTRKEFIQFMDMVMPKESLYFGMKLSQEQIKRDRRKILRRGWLFFCGDKVYLKREVKTKNDT